MAIMVTLIMFAFYVILLFLLARKALTNEALILVMFAAGLAFGLFSYALVVFSFNSIELHFMDTRGMLHAILVAPIQEEVAKFVNVVIAYAFITRSLSYSSEGSSRTDSYKSLAILGALVGLGFAATENLIDYGNLTILDTFKRTMMAWPLHMLSVAISAYGFHKYKATKKIMMLVGFLLSAIVIHILFNLGMILLNPF
jgi:RsiW-degrading membrane proteinase PrsW (M82 family)